MNKNEWRVTLNPCSSQYLVWVWSHCLHFCIHFADFFIIIFDVLTAVVIFIYGSNNYNIPIPKHIPHHPTTNIGLLIWVGETGETGGWGWGTSPHGPHKCQILGRSGGPKNTNMGPFDRCSTFFVVFWVLSVVIKYFIPRFVIAHRSKSAYGPSLSI